jgi:hypothetical protein
MKRLWLFVLAIALATQAGAATVNEYYSPKKSLRIRSGATVIDFRNHKYRTAVAAEITILDAHADASLWMRYPEGQGGTKPYTVPSVITNMDTIPLSLILDDGIESVMSQDSLDIFLHGTSNWRIGLGVIGSRVTSTTDTITGGGFLSAWDLQRAVEDYGWELGNHIWANNEGGVSWFSTSPVGAILDGSLTDARVWDMVRGGYLALRDSLDAITGYDFPAPRFFVHPGLVHFPMYRAIVASMHDFSYSGSLWNAGGSRSEVFALRYQEGFVGGVISATGTVGLHADPHYLSRQIIESTARAGGRASILKLMYRKEWINVAGHTAELFGSGSDWSLSEIVQFVDSLVTAGRVRIVTPSEGYDIMFKRPKASTVNVVWKNFDGAGDEAGNTLPAFVAVGSEVTFTTRDSIQQDGTSIDPHTVANGGWGPLNGYAVMSWDQLGAGFARDGSGTKGPWTRENWVYSVPNESDGNDFIRVEFMAQVDPAVDATPVGDSIGVSFLGTMIKDPEDFVNGAIWSADAGSADPADTKFWRSWSVGTTKLGNWQTFTNDHVVGTQWMQCVFKWRAPSRPEHIRFNIWKGARTPEDAVWVSNMHVSWEKQ